MKINILGTEYDFVITTDRVDSGLCEVDGYCDFFKKHIAIESEYSENLPGCTKDIDGLQRKVKRHELVHAFFFESGLREWAENEQLVDWVAVQFPKMLAAFQEVDAL